MRKLLIALSLSTALVMPLATYAQERHDDAREHHDDRYYDRHHKDYHEWNANEDRAYHMYWEQRHRPYVDWSSANESQRQAYWDWRHNHSDSVLQINIGHEH